MTSRRVSAPVIALPFADAKAYTDRYAEPDKVQTGLGAGGGAQGEQTLFRLVQTAEVLGEVHPSAQRCRRHPFVGARGATHDVANGLGRTPAQHTRRHQFGRLEIDPIGIVQSSQVIPRTCELSKVLAQHLMRHRRENRCLPITSTLV